MTEIVLTEQQSAAVKNARGVVRVRDVEGNVVGVFSPSEFAADVRYVEDLKSRVGASSAHVESLIREGLASGSPVEASDEWWEAKRARLEDRLDSTGGR